MDQGMLIGLVSLGVMLLFLIGVPIFLVIGFWVVGVSIIIDFTLANIGFTLFEGLNGARIEGAARPRRTCPPLAMGRGACTSRPPTCVRCSRARSVRFPPGSVSTWA